jgi:acetolactate synthase-1/2/3 large subunit
MTGAQAAVAALECHSVRCVYGVPGAQNNEFWDSMKAAGLPYLLVTNESSASVMADAAARVTGEVGVCAVVPGPGLTNAMTGIGEALGDSSPIVVLVTDCSRGPSAPVGQVHGLANSAIVRTVTKAVFEVHHAGQIPAAIFQAFRHARCGEPGPTAVVVPYELWLETWDFDEPVPLDLAPPWDEAAYRRGLCLLANRAKRIGIYAGAGCADYPGALLSVAELLEAPVATSVSGKGVLPDCHPLAVGWGYGPQATRAAEDTFRDRDIVLAVGVKYSEVSTAGYSIPAHHQIIHVDANPQNLGRNLPTCVAIPADAGMFLNRLLADAESLRRPKDQVLRCDIKRRRNRDRHDHAVVKAHCATDPMVFLNALGLSMPPGTWYFVDVTASVHFASETIELPGPRQYCTPANNQGMGWAIPAAIGAQRLAPHHPVACVTGDGCFLMSGLEMSTAARAALPVKFFVLDDGAYHYMQMLQEPAYGRTTATELAKIDYAAMARALGLGYNCIASNDDIAPGIARALHCPGPILTQVCIDYNGRDSRWFEALKDSYLDRRDRKEKLKLATRALARKANPMLQDD